MGLVFLDIETNGLNPAYHQPIEVGWVTLDDVATEFSLPFDVDKSEAKALEVNGYGRRQFAQLLSPAQAVGIIRKELAGQTIVANNVAFDLSFLAAFLRKQGVLTPPPWKHTGFELKSLVAGKLGVSPELVSTTTIVNHFKLEAIGKHTALGDARWNREIYLALQLYEG